MTSGCAQSLQLVISLLANPGQNILIPRPGFPLYKTLAHSIGVHIKYYESKVSNQGGNSANIYILPETRIYILLEARIYLAVCFIILFLIIYLLVYALYIAVLFSANQQPETEWGVDLESLEDNIDENTVAVITNSPFNPCGGVFSKEHVQEIIDICAAYKLPIIADEVYEHVVSILCMKIYIRILKYCPFYVM